MKALKLPVKRIQFIYLTALLLTVYACNENDGVGDTDASSPVLMDLSGVSQKGPFVIGSSVTIQELNAQLSPNGTSFQVATSDNLGTFSLNTEITTEFVEIICTGFYYNEVSGEVTNANLTVRNIAPVAENLNSNINILTTLANKRIVHLINESGLSYEDAKAQAEAEVLLVFNISSETIEGFDQMDITGSGESDAALLAISAMLQGEGSVSDLSILISSIIEDLEEDGILDNSSTKEQIIQNAIDISLSEVRSNLIAQYAEWGLNIDVPDFELFVDNLYENRPPSVSITSPIDGSNILQGQVVIVAVEAFDEDGEIQQVQIFLNDSLVSSSEAFSWQLKSDVSPQSIRAIAIDDENASTIDSIGFFVSENSIPAVEITAPDENDQFVEGETIEIVVVFSDAEDLVKRVSFYAEEKLLDEFSSPDQTTDLTIMWQVEGDGNTYLIAEAEDEFGGTNKDSLLISIVPNQLPTIALVSPLANDEIVYGSGNSLEVTATDNDGWIKKIDWYVENVFAGGTTDIEIPGQESIVTVTGNFDVVSTNLQQELRVEAIDNLDDTSSVSISLNLKPGAIWKEIGLLSSLEVSQAVADDDNFYIRSVDKVLRTADGFNPTEILDLAGNFYSHLLESVFDGKIWLVEWDEDLQETKVWSTSDQGDHWSFFATNYITISELFVFAGSIHAVDDFNHIYRLDNQTWTLVQSSTLPWIGDPNLDKLNIIDFNGLIVAVEENISSEERGVWTSTDLSTWNETMITVQDGAFSSRWIIEYQDAAWIFTQGNGIYRSTDGSGWEDISTNDITVIDSQAVAQKGEDLYMFSSTGEGALYKLELFGF